MTLGCVTPEAIQKALGGSNAFTEALVIRRQNGPLAYEPEALSLAATLGAQHLIVEDVSIDPEDDGGRFEAHRAWWGLEPGASIGRSARTITELATIPASAPDGRYFRRRKRGLCVTCGYDLRGSPERCPECGAGR